jgi:hypothetical protein
MRFATQECAFEKDVSTTWTGHDNFVADRFPVVPFAAQIATGRPGPSVGRTRAEAPKLRRRDRRVASSDVLEVEALAVRTGISGDEAQALIDRLGNDRAASNKPRAASRAKGGES